MLRASIAAESAGIPSVSLVCQGFERQSVATGRGHGFDDMRLGVLVGHVDAQSAEAMMANFIEVTMAQIIAGLTEAADGASTTAEAEPSALEVATSGTIDEINEVFADRGWSDGSPFVPPTSARVQAFLDVTGHDPWRVLGIASSSGRDMTVWSVAVNAVMAGCRPEYLPVLLAAAEILADESYGAAHSGNTTGADALMILNGPCVEDLGFNAGQGALREGTRANTTVGRWLRLYLRNVFDFTADEHDKATFGNSARVVLAEHHETLIDIGWPTVGSEFGFGVDDDVITMARFNSGLIIGSVFGSTPDEILPYLGDGLARSAGWDLTHVCGLGEGQFRPLLVLSPVLARVFASAGWTRDDVKRGLFSRARIPAWRFEKLIGEWTNVTAGRPTLYDLTTQDKLPPVFGVSDDPNRLVPIVTEPSKFMIAVAGDPNRTNAYVLANDGPHGDFTAKRIDRTFSTDLVCAVPATPAHR